MARKAPLKSSERVRVPGGVSNAIEDFYKGFVTRWEWRENHREHDCGYPPKAD